MTPLVKIREGDLVRIIPSSSDSTQRNEADLYLRNEGDLYEIQSIEYRDGESCIPLRVSIRHSSSPDPQVQSTQVIIQDFFHAP